MTAHWWILIGCAYLAAGSMVSYWIVSSDDFRVGMERSMEMAFGSIDEGLLRASTSAMAIIYLLVWPVTLVFALALKYFGPSISFTQRPGLSEVYDTEVYDTDGNLVERLEACESEAVSEIRIDLVIGQRCRSAYFIRRENIDELLNEEGTLGDFLRKMRDGDFRDGQQESA